MFWFRGKTWRKRECAVPDLLRIAHAIPIPQAVPVSDGKQLDTVYAGKPFAQLRYAGMKNAAMYGEIMSRRDPTRSRTIPTTSGYRSCTHFWIKRPTVNKSNGSRSVVYSEGPLRSLHELLESTAVQKVVLDFLNRHQSH